MYQGLELSAGKFLYLLPCLRHQKTKIMNFISKIHLPYVDNILSREDTSGNQTDIVTFHWVLFLLVQKATEKNAQNCQAHLIKKLQIKLYSRHSVFYDQYNVSAA